MDIRMLSLSQWRWSVPVPLFPNGDVCCLFPNGDGEGELLAGRDERLAENQTEMHRRVI